jgi:CheY-like chemotaxis protein
MHKILVAEDDGAVREFVVRALARQGHEVTAVENASQALEALAQGRFDLLLTDIVMPGMDGIALALKVAKTYPNLPIVLMSGYAAERQRAHNLDTLIRRVVAKPFTLKEICSVVRESLPDRAYRSGPTRH